MPTATKPAPAPAVYELLLTPNICGAWLTGGDGVLLGKVSGNPFSNDSVISVSGKYGSPTGSTSIWNEFGQYGNESGFYSAFNDFAVDPPELVRNQVVLGVVTTGTTRVQRVNPSELRAWLEAGNCSYD